MRRNEIAKQYRPLVIKVASQIARKSGARIEDCISAGNVGLVYAIDNYKSDQTQTFTQYCAWMIRFYILNDLNQHGHIIRINADQQHALQAKGLSTNLVSSLDAEIPNEDGETKLEKHIKGDDENSVYAAIDPSALAQWSIIYHALADKFNKRDVDIFCSSFGVNGREEVKGKDLAEKYGVSPAAVTQVRNKIIAYLRKSDELRSILLGILEMMS